jgi:glutamyl-tRNA reductase
MTDALDAADFAVVAVSGGALIRSEHIRTRGARAPLHVLDLSVPHAVDIASRPDVDVHDLEDLEAHQTSELSGAVTDAERMVREAVDELQHWMESRASGRAVGELRTHAELVARAEVARALGGMSLDPEDAERVSGMALRIANKLMHGPSVSMRDGDDHTRTVIRDMFGLE